MRSRPAELGASLCCATWKSAFEWVPSSGRPARFVWDGVFLHSESREPVSVPAGPLRFDGFLWGFQNKVLGTRGGDFGLGWALEAGRWLQTLKLPSESRKQDCSAVAEAPGMHRGCEAPLLANRP